MKKLLLLAGTAIVAATVSANAADLPMRAYKAPPPPPLVAPVYNWTGFYVGGHFGGGWAREAWEERSDFSSGTGFGSIGHAIFDGVDCTDGFTTVCPFRDLANAPGSTFGQGGAVGSHNAIGPLGGFQAG